jgi:hypothetical protein
MQAAYDLLWGSSNLAAVIRSSAAGCARMSNADLISIAGYVAVVMSGGTATSGSDAGCGWYPGRKDVEQGFDPLLGYDNTNSLPSESFNAAGSTALVQPQ